MFGMLALSGPTVLMRDGQAAVALLAVSVIWVSAIVAELLRASPFAISVVESALIATVGALTLDITLAVVGALAVPPFVASIRRGPQGLVTSLSIELIVIVTLSLVLRGPMEPEQAGGALTWLTLGLGLGLIGSFVRASLISEPDALSPYRDAQALIRELIDLSGSLSSGLDPASLAATVAEALRDELPVSTLLVHIPRDGGLSPLVIETDGSVDAEETLGELSSVASRTVRPAISGGAFAFPLMTDAGLVAVVAGQLPAGLDPTSVQLEARLDALAARLEPTAVHLDTALLFTAFRDAATSDERRRLAREMHDGIAQDIASLGYLVDNLSSQPSSPSQAVQLRQLRERISSVVSEVRASVKTLRTEVGSNQSLGAAISALARELNASSSIPIHVTVDEQTSRLRTEVEAELLRIAQEAMTNAVRHSGASTIEVVCRVHAPEAEVVVRDDGHGLQPGRHDSQGIEIMHERARLIGAELRLENAEPRGTVMAVRLPSPPPTPTTPISDDRVTA